MPSDQIKDLSSNLTIVGGRIVWADGDFKTHAPSPLPVSPSWSPVKQFGGYQQGGRAAAQRAQVDVGLPGVLDRVSGLLCGCSRILLGAWALTRAGLGGAGPSLGPQVVLGRPRLLLLHLTIRRPSHG